MTMVAPLIMLALYTPIAVQAVQPPPPPANDVQYPLVLLDKYVDSPGAKCLDGSPAAFYIQQGPATLNDSWVIHLCGGGWCYNNETDALGGSEGCIGRSKSQGLGGGSSRSLPKDGFDGSISGITTVGLLSNDQKANPDFYNFTKVFVNYCDGLSFTGDRDDPVTVDNTTLWFRGKRILEAVITELKSNHGLSAAKKVILSGNSAGGLAVFLHLDKVRSMLPQTTDLLGFADGGFFLDQPAVDGTYRFRAKMQGAFDLSKAKSGVSAQCAAANPGNEWRCIFAENMFPYINTSIFVLESTYDSWQNGNILGVDCLGFPQGPLTPACNGDPKKMALVHGYQQAMLKALEPVKAKAKGLFVDACIAHCQATVDGRNIWNHGVNQVDGRNIAETFGDCYWGRGNCTALQTCKLGDDCNPTCTSGQGGQPPPVEQKSYAQYYAAASSRPDTMYV